MLKDKSIHVKGSADRFRDFIHVDDVVESFFRCLSCIASNGKVINIANGKATKVKEIIELLVSSQSNQINVKYDGGTPGDIHGIYADISRMNNIFGTWNKVELQDGLEMMVRFYSEYNEFFKKPVDHLGVCEFNTYSLQLSLYAYLYELSSGKKCSGLVIFYKNNDAWYPIRLNYMKREIIALIEDYNNPS